MKQVICPICGSVCIKYGKNKSGSQRWFCKRCKSICTPKIDNSSKQLNIFLKWLFSKQTQREMTGEGRTFRRKTSMFWDIWPMPPIVATDIKKFSSSICPLKMPLAAFQMTLYPTTVYAAKNPIKPRYAGLSGKNIAVANNIAPIIILIRRFFILCHLVSPSAKSNQC